MTTKSKAKLAKDENETTGALAQASAGALAVIPIEQIHPHPKNIRTNAHADDELIASIRTNGVIQPLIVRPGHERRGTDDAAPRYELLAGHRRLDALLRLEASHATCVIRRDVSDEGDQIVTMLGENDARENLTPLEQAHGYNLLAELGWSDSRIGKATGHSATTVKGRRSLTTLAKPARTQLDNGQITIEQGIALAALPEAEQVKVARSQLPFAYALAQAVSRTEHTTQTMQRATELEAAGAIRKALPAGITAWGLTTADHGMTRLDRTGLIDESDHDGCLGYVIEETPHRGADLHLVCTDQPRHDDALTEAQREQNRAEADREAERARAVAEYQAERDARELGSRLRIESVVGAVKSKALDPTLEAVLRLWLTHQASDTLVSAPALAAVGLDQATLDDDPQAVSRLTTPQLITLFVHDAAVDIDGDLHNSSASWVTTPSPVAAGWFALLDSIGHERNPEDERTLAAALHLDRDNEDGDA